MGRTGNAKATASVEDLQQKLVLTGADIMAIGEIAETIVGGKNFNTAHIHEIPGVRTPQFRAISSLCFHKLLDECFVNAALVRSLVDKEYARIDWNDPNINQDAEFVQKLVRNLSREIRSADAAQPDATRIRLRTFVNNVVEGFATSQEMIDQLRKRSVLVQASILSVTLPKAVDDAVRQAYRDICKEAGEPDVPVAVRSSAAGEDSRKKAFAGLQDTYLNMVGEDRVVQAYHWDCASAYNLRSMTYRREAIRDGITRAEATGDESLALQAKQEWAIEHTSLSVCIMRMINPVIAGTAFSADTASGCRGTKRKDLVSIDASYGLGEAIVGGMVTPDKYYVFQRDDGAEVVIRNLGSKIKKIVYDEKGGTKQVDVPENDVYRWALSISLAEQVARSVRTISKAYGGMIMDTEFCIDSKEQLWFVQARPETRWNEEFEQHPDTIFMRRLEVDAKAAEAAEVLVEGNGASRGAGQGTVRFLRSALELNKVAKGDILAAERTDPDMVPGMRVAAAIMANVGGDTSHAAITSRELGIPAVIGIQRLETLRALDGQDVTVDGTKGCVYRGLLPLHDVGGEMNLATLPSTKTHVGLVLADVNQALFLSRLRNVPDFEVGLLRAEFMLGNVGVHPQALEALDNGTLQSAVEGKLAELDSALTKTVQEQLSAGLVMLDLKLRDHVGHMTGLAEEIEATAALDVHGAEQMLAQQRKLRELEHKLDEYFENAMRYQDALRTSGSLEDHVRIIYGFEEELALLSGEPADVQARREAITAEVKALADKVRHDPFLEEAFRRITDLRREVGLKCGLTKEMDDLRSVPEKIASIIRARGYRTGKEHYVQTLAQGLAMFAMAFYGKPIIYRTTDFKSNEYRNLLGGILFEKNEDNPMLGYRGVSRQIHDWEIEAFKLARGVYGGSNLQLMLPFVRTLEEARSMRRYLASVHKLVSGQDDLKIIQMSEIPSNAILARQFIQEFDGFSIGSNDMTQMVLATDRDNASLQHIYDEEDPAVVWALLTTIFTGQKYGKKVGFCGQGVSNSHILRGLVAIAGIVSASVVPDTYYKTKLEIAEVEADNIPASRLGQWLCEQHLKNLRALMEAHGFGHFLKKYTSGTDLREWYEGESERLHENLRKSLGTPKEAECRAEMAQFRATFHKPAIYASWPWEETVEDALHQAGFASFEEQALALEAQRAAHLPQ
ncbi:MAG: phosphoenolpyruvate synthase [Desulfovibrionaceae bacterium]|nr:phosphoenolpyruvate synthase [Desulfovibrionaceae bacterium]